MQTHQKSPKKSSTGKSSRPYIRSGGFLLTIDEPGYLLHRQKQATYVISWLYITSCVVTILVLLLGHNPLGMFGIYLNRSNGHEPGGHRKSVFEFAFCNPSGPGQLGPRQNHPIRRAGIYIGKFFLYYGYAICYKSRKAFIRCCQQHLALCRTVVFPNWLFLLLRLSRDSGFNS